MLLTEKSSFLLLKNRLDFQLRSISLCKFCLEIIHLAHKPQGEKGMRGIVPFLGFTHGLAGISNSTDFMKTGGLQAV